ncbi:MULTISPECIES: hypothetical protein [unclassified Lysinibacillus]|uniref:hypothetical protein n=1 Tax=unclassified Lysinibacillus TaxID=2636778 RepID=UPI0008853220|nr:MULTISPECIES: hypothetical protein [unclassified Lysinibacillus]SCY87269.1 hypothetical protein SAMN02787078_02815 [Lysinibacillus sp. SG9]SDB38385.1 hypothetical protein SAMN02787079_02855 [Lysinibacillus sp. TC-37]SFT02414.1 hypothetical protein SAMN02787087_03110 [Lysinibacillus sp. SG55]
MAKIKQHSQTKNLSNGKSIICGKCKSDQIVASRRGYSFSAAFKTLLVMLGIVIVLAIFLPGLDDVSGFADLNIIGTLLLFLGLPIAIFYGFIDRNSLINGCMNCGNRWIAGKK